MKKLVVAALASGALLIGAPAAFAGEGDGASNSHGTSAHGNAVSSGATPRAPAIRLPVRACELLAVGG